MGSTLFELVVAGDPPPPLLPQEAEAGLLPGRAEFGPVDLEVERETLGQLVDETVGLGKR